MNDTNHQTQRCVFILAGEASGDLYGGMLVKALLKSNPELKVIAWGGEHMEEAGAQVLRHYKTMAFMGFLEVIKNLGTIRTLFRECEQLLLDHQPNTFVGIDYPGFNLKMAAKAQALGLTTHHYISPSLWAWNKNRVNTIREHIDQLHVILPFEKQWFAEHDVEVNWVGHPLIELERSERVGFAENGSDSSPILALFPGSRGQELERLLPVFLEVAAGMPLFRPIIAGAPGLESSQYQLASDSGVEVQFGKTRELMKQAAIGLVTSGTATLEAALLGMPQVICYRTSFVTYQIAKRLAKTAWIGLPNIIAQDSIVPERIQKECTAANLLKDISRIHDGKKLLKSGKKQMECIEKLRRQLEGPQEPSTNVAEAILDYNPRNT